mgnify:FL=1
MQQFVRGVRYLIEGHGAGWFALYVACVAVSAVCVLAWVGSLALLAYILALAWGVYGTGEVEGDDTETNAEYDPLRRK